MKEAVSTRDYLEKNSNLITGKRILLLVNTEDLRCRIVNINTYTEICTITSKLAEMLAECSDAELVYSEAGSYFEYVVEYKYIYESLRAITYNRKDYIDDVLQQLG